MFLGVMQPDDDAEITKLQRTLVHKLSKIEEGSLQVRCCSYEHCVSICLPSGWVTTADGSLLARDLGVAATATTVHHQSAGAPDRGPGGSEQRPAVVIALLSRRCCWLYVQYVSELNN